MPMTEEQALAVEGQSAFTPTPSPTGGLMTPSTFLQELVDPGSTAPPPSADTSMYYAPVEAQYQSGGESYVPYESPPVASEYYGGAASAPPTTYPAYSDPGTIVTTYPAANQGVPPMMDGGLATNPAYTRATVTPVSNPYPRQAPVMPTPSSPAISQRARISENPTTTVRSLYQQGPSNPYANVRTTEYPGVARLNPSLMRPTTGEPDYGRYFAGRFAQPITPPSLAGAGSGSLIPFQPPPPIMDPMRSTEGDSVSDIAPTISPSDIPAPGGDPFAGWGTNVKVGLNRLKQWGRENIADPAPAQESRDPRGNPIAPVRDTPFSPAMDRAASTSYVPGATLLPSELLQPRRNTANAAPVTDPYGAWKGAFDEGNPYLVRRSGEVRGLGVGLAGSRRQPQPTAPTTPSTPTSNGRVTEPIPDQKRAITQVVTIDDSGRPAVTGYAASGRQPQGAVHVTEAMIDALIAGGVKINRDTAMQTLLGQRAVLPPAWMELLGAAPAETTETAPPATENPYTVSSSNTSSSGGSGSTWVDYGSSGRSRSSGSGGRGYSYGYDSANGTATPETIFAQDASEGDEDADMWDNPIFARYFAILEGRYGREGAMRRMRGMSRRFRFGNRLSRSTRPSSRSKTRSRAVSDGDTSSSVPTNAGIRKDVTKRVKKATT